MPTRWFILLASLILIVMGVLSLRAGSDCSATETSAECTISRGYQALWNEAASQKAVQLFTQAVAADPASPHRWADLADALLIAGNRDQAAQCSRRSVELGPAIPTVLQRAINFGVSGGCGEHVLLAAGRLLDTVSADPDDLIFGQLNRANCSARNIQDRMLSRYPAAASRYLWWLMKTGDVPAAASAWEWMRSKNLGTSDLEREYRAFVAEKQGAKR